MSNILVNISNTFINVVTIVGNAVIKFLKSYIDDKPNNKTDKQNFFDGIKDTYKHMFSKRKIKTKSIPYLIGRFWSTVSSGKILAFFHLSLIPKVGLTYKICKFSYPYIKSGCLYFMEQIGFTKKNIETICKHSIEHRSSIIKETIVVNPFNIDNMNNNEDICIGETCMCFECGAIFWL